MLDQVCFYNTIEKNYVQISLPNLEENQNLQAKPNRKIQYRIYLNKQEKETLVVINFDRDFYLYSHEKYLKTLSLRDFQEIFVDYENNEVFIYGFKDEILNYITIDNTKKVFVLNEIFNNFLLIAKGYNQLFALIDTNNSLTA